MGEVIETDADEKPEPVASVVGDVYKRQVHVRCLIDEAANIGQIPRLEKLVATIRSREISALSLIHICRSNRLHRVFFSPNPSKTS